ncbi:MAG TPA: cytochrome C oxidase subunit IV family protein [Planctomycetota bacterium]|nr:cytochrome C oxidase subunit IV family protein [Planctomycetota bacterium]
MSTHDAHGPAGQSPAHVSHRAEYIRTFVALTVITVVEVALSFVMVGTPLIVMLVAAALAKVVLVGGVFMHLKFEVKSLVLICVSPILFAAILIFGLMPDATRMFLDRMPGTVAFHR